MSEIISADLTYLPETTSSTVTSFLPFTTPFPFSGCTPLFTMQILTQLALNYYTLPGNKKCSQPSPFKVPTTSLGVTTVFNTGPINCLSPYVTASTSVIKDSTTLVACCPSNYTFFLYAPNSFLTTTEAFSNFEGGCTSGLGSGAVILYRQFNTVITSTTQTDTSALPASFVSTTITKPTVVVADAFTGKNIAVVGATASVSISSNSSQPPSNGPTLSSTASSTSSTTNNATHRLSQNSLVGITIGGAFGLFLVLSVVIWLMIRRRRIALAKIAENQARKMGGEWKQELPGWNQKFELHGKMRQFELASDRHLAHEMAVQERPLELAG